MVKGGGMHGEGGHAWQKGGVWQRGGMHGEGGHAWDTTRYGNTINERAVSILLECILVVNLCLCRWLDSRISNHC